MTLSTWLRSARSAALLSCSLAFLPAAYAAPPVTAPLSTDTVPLLGHLPVGIARAHPLRQLDANEPIRFAIALPLRNQAALDDLLRRLYDPNDPAYGHFLTPDQFRQQFSPTRADYDAVVAYARAQGLTVVGTYSNRTLVDVTAPSGVVEKALNVKMLNYQTDEGRQFRAPSVEPSVPKAMVGRLSGFVGLDTMAVWTTHIHKTPVSPFDTVFSPRQTGSGPGGALTPSDIKAAYNLSGLTLNGSGQTLGLFELDGYTASDITSYENAYGLPNVTLQNVLVDTATGSAGSGAVEVTLDIELQVALAPKATKVMVYEGPNSSSGVVDTYNRIASDNLAKEISTSWGAPEAYMSSSTRNSENTAFQQMASQGQSIFAAAGDSGAYDNGYPQCG